jgi:hypothetical protein
MKRVTSGNGTFRTWRDVRLESGMRTKADVHRPLGILSVHALIRTEPLRLRCQGRLFGLPERLLRIAAQEAGGLAQAAEREQVKPGDRRGRGLWR